jgi:hypothetical protein
VLNFPIFHDKAFAIMAILAVEKSLKEKEKERNKENTKKMKMIKKKEKEK